MDGEQLTRNMLGKDVDFVMKSIENGAIPKYENYLANVLGKLAIYKSTGQFVMQGLEEFGSKSSLEVINESKENIDTTNTTAASIAESQQPVSNVLAETKQIKVEPEEEMPAPKIVPSKRKKNIKVAADPVKIEPSSLSPAGGKRGTRSQQQSRTRSQARTTNQQSLMGIEVKMERKDSDVICQESVPNVIDLIADSNSDDGELSQPLEAVQHTTKRTKTRRNRKTKRVRSNSSDVNEGNGDGKRSKSVAVNDDALLEQQQQQEATLEMTFITASPVNKNLKETHQQQHNREIADDTSDIVNTTLVIDNPKVIKNQKDSDKMKMLGQQHEEEVLENNGSKGKLLTLKTNKTGNNKKQLFSAFEQSPVKKKVEAFEKLRTDTASALPIRSTRIRQKAAEMVDNNEHANQKEIPLPQSSLVREKSKLTTPTNTRSTFRPKTFSTATKPVQSHSDFKAAQSEYVERERRRREKDDEAQRKKEAILKARIDEQKRIREEKQLKAQKQREILESTRLQALEVQIKREQKQQLLLAEQEAKRLKMLEEVEHKRVLAKQRALKERKGEGADLPIYMRYKPPLLPTLDCYDSDDPDYSNHKVTVPTWTQPSPLKSMLKIQSAAGAKIKNTYFCCQAETPVLEDIFEGIDPRKLKRTSSAIWHKPPRYTLIPGLDGHHEFSDDE